ncbi:MAG: class I SAM-dependent DNA methyltransferase [Lachnospiraceae bacterium]
MESYYSFAWVYDTFMDNIPYDEWTEYLAGLLKEYGVSQGLLLDMGCGTGSVTERLASRGYDMIGIDNSEEMLMEARDKMVESGQDILYLLQDMRSFELYGTVAAAVSICDSMNYILETEDLEQVFRLVNNYLDPQGIFIFDYNTPYKYREVIGNQVIAENREDCSFIWENTFDEGAQVNIYDLTIFIQEEEEDGLFRRYQETHYQKAWKTEDMVRAAENAGMKVLAVYDAFTHDAPKPESERLYMIVQEQGKVRAEEKLQNTGR